MGEEVFCNKIQIEFKKDGSARGFTAKFSDGGVLQGIPGDDTYSSTIMSKMRASALASDLLRQYKESKK